MRSFFSNLATRLRRDQRGATAVEYGIMVSLIAVVIIIAVTAPRRHLERHLQSASSAASGRHHACTTAVPASAGVTARAR